MNNQRSREPLRGKKLIFSILGGMIILTLCVIIVSAIRLPTVGGDSDGWGTILNTFLNVSHNESGELRNDTVSTAQIIDGTITDADISDTTNLTIDSADFGGGWLSDGVSIIGGSIYAQVGYFYNITSLNVTRLNLTILDNLDVVNNVTSGYFIGDGSLLTGIVSGLWTNSSNDATYTAGNVGIGTTSPNEKLTVNGSISLFAGNYTPDVTSGYVKIFARNGTDGNDQFTKLLLHMDGDDGSQTFVDSSNSSHEITAFDNAQMSITQKKFGVTSAYFDGTGDYLSIDDHADWDFGTGDWTVDFWYYGENTATSAYLFSAKDGNLRIAKGGAGDGALNVYYSQLPVDQWYITGTITMGAWHHIAVIRESGTMYHYIDGVKQASPEACAGSQDHTGWDIGRRDLGDNYMKGYLDEVRISKGFARWTSNFTVPDRAYDKGGLYYKDDEGNIVELAGGKSFAWSSYWVKNDEGIYYVGDVNITGDLNVTGNVTASHFIGDGSELTGITGGIWSNSSGTATYNGNISVTGNVTLTQKITFALGEIIDNIVDGWITITGNLNVTESMYVGGSLNVTGDLNVSGTIYGDISSDAYYRYYDTGWVPINYPTNDWKNQHLGTTVGGNVVHNFNAPLSNLTVKVLISNGTEASNFDDNSFEVNHISVTEEATPDLIYGIQMYAVDDNNIKIQTGRTGIWQLDDAGGAVIVDAEAWYYKIVVTRIVRLNTTPLFGGTPAGAIMSFNLASCPNGWILADGSSGTPDLSPYEYDTGWLDNDLGTGTAADWANVHLGDDPTDPTDDVTHNLNAPLSDLLVKVIISENGGDADSFEIQDVGWDRVAGARGDRGWIVYQVDNDNLKVQTGLHGLNLLDDVGELVNIAAQDWYYKIKVSKKFSGNSSLIYCMKTTEDSVTSNTLWGESGDNIFMQNASKNLQIGSTLVIAEINETPQNVSGFGKLYMKNGTIGNDANTKLLIHADGVDGAQVFVDDSANGFTVDDFGHVNTDDGQKKFGVTSALFDGNGDYLFIADDSDLDFGTGDFTIDFWVRLNSIQQSGTSTVVRNMMIGKPGYNVAGGWILAYVGTGGGTDDKLKFFTGTTEIVSSDADVLTTNQWYHIAVSRSGTTVYLFIDGILVDTGTSSTNFANAQGVRVGQDPSYSASDRDLDGWMDEIRITKGKARWTSTFTPPSSAYDKGGLFFMFPDGTEVNLA